MEPGRRLRVFMRLLSSNPYATPPVVYLAQVAVPALSLCTYREALAYLTLHEKDYPLQMDLRINWANILFTTIPEKVQQANAELHVHLQDLADMIIIDTVDACNAIDDPTYYYPGVDPPLIEPVSDDHVQLVIWAINRELYREQARLGKPAPDLDKLPWYVQRALVERRRYRYAQYGIGRKEYESNKWSPWNIHEDPDWTPLQVL